MTEIECVLTVAKSYQWVREQPANSNRGQAVEHILSVVGLPPGNPWCAAYVAKVGRDVLGPRWPLPLTGGCAALGEAARKKGILMDTPEPGDVFLIFNASLKRFAHTGFIVAATSDGKWQTIEGNTAGDGRREGWGVFQRTRRFASADRFIRWAAA